MTMTNNTRSKLTLAALMIAASVPNAYAGCHLVDCVENVYVKPAELKAASCETLWTLRNSIYKDGGYCFKTPAAIKAFGNAGCSYDDQLLVPLNDYQHTNVKTIRSVEDAKGCVPPQ